VRTGPPDGRQRHVGLSQLLVELGQPGVTIRPIISMTGEHHFNEVVFDGVFVPEIAAALVKDIGTRLESEIIEVARMLTAAEPDPGGAGLAGLLAHAVLHAPGFTLRGGTNEILRGIVARGLALR
jgi:alkylation response protein AidB-like acyl-CoA dehydrogenase